LKAGAMRKKQSGNIFQSAIIGAVKRQKQIHPAHNPRFNHDLQLEIDCIEWALKKIEVNKLPNDRLEAYTSHDQRPRKEK
jgi:hypothetical protein